MSHIPDPVGPVVLRVSQTSMHPIFGDDDNADIHEHDADADGGDDDDDADAGDALQA